MFDVHIQALKPSKTRDICSSVIIIIIIIIINVINVINVISVIHEDIFPAFPSSSASVTTTLHSLSTPDVVAAAHSVILRPDELRCSELRGHDLS
jgi:hypothetical protein